MPTLEEIKKIPPKVLLKLIQRGKDYLKKNEVMQEICDKYNFDINDIDFIPVRFGDIDVSARTDKGIVTLNWKLLADGDFFKDFAYLVHEFGHYIQQSNEPTQSADDGDYLMNPSEQEAFQYQVKYIDEQFGEEEAADYVEQVLDHHGEEGQEREKKEDILFKLVDSFLHKSERLKKHSFINTKFYHSSNTLYKIGDVVKPGVRPNEIEAVFEKVRREEFPDRPSRLTCIFLSTQDKYSTSRWADERRYLYEVEIEGNDYFLTDGKTYSDAYNESNSYHRSHPEILAIVRKYWRGVPNVNEANAPEFLTDSPVIVVSEPLIHRSKHPSSFIRREDDDRWDVLNSPNHFVNMPEGFSFQTIKDKYELSRNKDTTGEQLHDLAKDDSTPSGVRFNIIEHRKVKEETIKMLLNDPDPVIKNRAKMRLGDFVRMRSYEELKRKRQQSSLDKV